VKEDLSSLNAEASLEAKSSTERTLVTQLLGPEKDGKAGLPSGEAKGAGGAEKRTVSPKACG